MRRFYCTKIKQKIQPLFTKSCKGEYTMQQMIPLQKQSKKKQREHYEKQRANWHGVCPITRVVPNKKASHRKRDKFCFKDV